MDTTQKRATYKLHDSSGRTVEGDADSAVLIADGVVHAAADLEGAWDAWVALTDFLCQHLQPSERWRTAHIARAHGRSAEGMDSHAAVDARSLTTPSSMLALCKEVLGPDAYAKLRKAAADKMLGRV